MENDFIKQQKYLITQKQIKDIKGFYTHCMASFLILPFIIFINLKFVPEFHFFWFVLGGMLIAMFFHWLGAIGFEVLGFGKQWEERKTKEILKNYK